MQKMTAEDVWSNFKKHRLWRPICNYQVGVKTRAGPLGALSLRVKNNCVDLAGDTLGCAYSIVNSE